MFCEEQKRSIYEEMPPQDLVDLVLLLEGKLAELGAGVNQGAPQDFTTLWGELARLKGRVSELSNKVFAVESDIEELWDKVDDDS